MKRVRTLVATIGLLACTVQRASQANDQGIIHVKVVIRPDGAVDMPNASNSEIASVSQQDIVVWNVVNRSEKKQNVILCAAKAGAVVSPPEPFDSCLSAPGTVAVGQVFTLEGRQGNVTRKQRLYCGVKIYGMPYLKYELGAFAAESPKNPECVPPRREPPRGYEAALEVQP
jgi:hypothetical protein